MTERFGSRSAGRWVLVRLSQFLSCLHLFNGDVAAKFPPMSLCAEDKVGLDELPIEASRICPLTHPPSHKHPPPPPRTRTRPILARARTHTPHTPPQYLRLPHDQSTNSTKDRRIFLCPHQSTNGQTHRHAITICGSPHRGTRAKQAGRVEASSLRPSPQPACLTAGASMSVSSEAVGMLQQDFRPDSSP